MTPGEIVWLSGRETDALIAEKVMGWRDIRWEATPTPKVPDLKELTGLPPGCSQRFGVWWFSLSLNDAWFVVDWLIAQEPNGDFHLEHTNEEGWAVGFCGREEWVTADTAPLAICRAALLVASAKEGKSE